MQENNKENNIGQQGNMEDQAGTTDDDINENYSKNAEGNKIIENVLTEEKIDSNYKLKIPFKNKDY